MREGALSRERSGFSLSPWERAGVREERSGGGRPKPADSPNPKRMFPSSDLSGGAVIELRVERPAVGGRMIARHDGRVVLVGGAIPGDAYPAAVERSRGGVVLARTVEVLEGSLDRRRWRGAPACGGCSLRAHRLPAPGGAEVGDRSGRVSPGRTDRAVCPSAGHSLTPRRGTGCAPGFTWAMAGWGSSKRGRIACATVAGTGQLLPKTERLGRDACGARGRTGQPPVPGRWTWPRISPGPVRPARGRAG